MGGMMTRYNQLLCIIGLTFMVGCTDCSDMSDDGVTASTTMDVCGDLNQAPNDDVLAPTASLPEIQTSICDRDRAELNSEYTVWDGLVTLKDLEAVKDYTLIRGHIDWGTISNNNTNNEVALHESIDLPNLQVICGTVSVFTNHTLVHINLPQLQTIAGEFLVQGGEALQSINFPKLQTIDTYSRGGRNDFEIFVYGGDLQNIDLSALQTIHVDFSLIGNSFQSLDLSELQTVQGDFSLIGNSFQSLDLSKLQTVQGDFSVEDNEALANLNVLKLQTVGGSFTLGSSAPIRKNVDLQSVNLPRLKTIGGFGQISFYEGATSLNLPQLKSVGGWFGITSNSFTCIDLSQLQTVGSDERTESDFEEGFFYQTGLQFLDNRNIPENLVLPRLQSVDGDIAFSGNVITDTVSMPQLQSIGHNLEVIDTLLSTIDMPQLQSVGGVFKFDDRLNPTECNLGSYTDAQCP